MIKFGIIFVALSLTPCLSLQFHGSKAGSHHGPSPLRFVQHREGGPLKLDDMVKSVESMENYNIRRAKPRGPYQNGKAYDVNEVVLNKLKSLELDKSLANYLDLDARGQNAVKQNVGFKLVNVNDFDTDRQKSKRSNLKKVKLVQSLEPPQNFFKSVPNRIINDPKASPANMYKQSEKPRSKSVFDKNGMMFLTQPRDSEGRKLTHLVNKIMQVKSEYERGSLRQPTARFTPNEMKQMRLIAQAMDEESRLQDNANELDQLLQEEQLLQQLNDLSKEDEFEIVVAELVPDTNEVKILPNKLRIEDILNLQSEEDNNNEVARVLAQLVNEQRFDEDDEDRELPDTRNPLTLIPSDYEKDTRLKQISRAIQEPTVDKRPEAASAGTAQHQFNFEELVA